MIRTNQNFESVINTKNEAGDIFSETQNDGENYFRIYSFMLDMGLRLAKLSIYAYVHSYTVFGEGFYYGSTEHLASIVGISKRYARKMLRELCDDGFLIPFSEENKSGYKCAVTVNNFRAARSDKKKERDSFKSDNLIFRNEKDLTQGYDPHEGGIYKIESIENPSEENSLFDSETTREDFERKYYTRCFLDDTLNESDTEEEAEKENELSRYEILAIKSRRIKPTYSYLDLGINENVSLSEQQYNELLTFVNTEALTAYIRKLELMIRANERTGRKSPKNHYALIKKWILEDYGI